MRCTLKLKVSTEPMREDPVRAMDNLGYTIGSSSNRCTWPTGAVQLNARCYSLYVVLSILAPLRIMNTTVAVQVITE